MPGNMLNKRLMTNEEWLSLSETATSLVSESEIAELEEKAVAEIRATVNGKRAAYAWSGGSDSSILTHLCQKAGVKPCMIGICNLEYPAFMDWLSHNAPPELTVVNTGQDLEWLAEHPSMLFPQGSALASRWYAIVQQAAQREYSDARSIGVMILGRRKADSNYVGRGSNIYTDRYGVTRYSPMSEWKHAHVLAYIKYRGLQLPPLYQWENGFRNGTHPWPARQYVSSVADGWRAIYGIDQSIVRTAAAKIRSAAEFLEGVV